MRLRQNVAMIRVSHRASPTWNPLDPDCNYRMTTYRVLLPHPLETRLLMAHAHGEWRLPEWEDATEHPWQAMDHVNRAVAARCARHRG